MNKELEINEDQKYFFMNVLLIYRRYIDLEYLRKMPDAPYQPEKLAVGYMMQDIITKILKELEKKNCIAQQYIPSIIQMIFFISFRINEKMLESINGFYSDTYTMDDIKKIKGNYKRILSELKLSPYNLS